MRQAAHIRLATTSSGRVRTGRLELTGRGFSATGADLDEGMIALARSRFPDDDFQLASAEALPYDDGTFQGYRADKVVHSTEPRS